MPTGKIAFSSGRYGDYDIFLFDFTTGQLAQLTSDQHWNDYPRLSFDGRRLAFTSWRGNRQEIRVMELDGGPESQSVTPNLNFAAFPCWSPDGTEIAFAVPQETETEILAVTLKTGATRRLALTKGYDAYPDWSPDGKRIAYSSQRRQNQDVYALDLSTFKEERVTEHPAPDTSPAFSPDGSRIAFVSQRPDAPRGFRFFDSLWDFFYGDDDLDVWVVELGSGKLKQITTNKGVDRNVRWSPDGRHLAFTSSAVDRAEARIMIGDHASGKIAPLEYDWDVPKQELQKTLDVESLTLPMTRYHPWLASRTPTAVEEFLRGISRTELDQIYFPVPRYMDWR